MNFATGVALGYALSAQGPATQMPTGVAVVFALVVAVCFAIIIWGLWQMYKDTK